MIKVEKAARDAMAEIGRIGLTLPRRNYLEYLRVVLGDLRIAIEAEDQEAR